MGCDPFLYNTFRCPRCGGSTGRWCNCYRETQERFRHEPTEDRFAMPERPPRITCTDDLFKRARVPRVGGI